MKIGSPVFRFCVGVVSFLFFWNDFSAAAARSHAPETARVNTPAGRITKISWSGNGYTSLGISSESYVLCANGAAHRVHIVDVPNERRYDQYIGRISSPTFDELAHQLQRDGFSDLSNRYRVAYPVTCSVTAAVIDGKQKTIERWDIQDGFTVGPPELRAIESSIRRVASSIKWQKDPVAEKTGVSGIVVRLKKPGTRNTKPEPCRSATVSARGAATVLAMMNSAVDGQFCLHLPPGDYILEAMSSKQGAAVPERSSEQRVIVQSGKLTRVLLEIPSD